MYQNYPLVSIVVPIYNTERFLDRCLKSITGQTYTDLEIILVDDGSTDTSSDIAERYESKDKRVHLIKQANKGASSARNTGLDTAHGDYVMFVDSDDWIDPNMVETLLNDIKENKADMVLSQVPYDKHVSERKKLDKDESLSMLLYGAWWGPVGKLFSKTAIQDIRFPKATISEDYVFMLHTILNCETIYYTPECFYHREIREGSLSRLSISERKFEEFDNVSYVANFIRQNYPQFRQPAEARMAETSLKLLFAIYGSKKESVFSNQQKMLIHSIRNNIIRYIPNNNILMKTRTLLLMSTSSLGSKMAYNMYSQISK